MICRDCAALEAGMCVRLPKNFVQRAVPRTNLIIRTKKQNYCFAIDLAHISIAKLGWLCAPRQHIDDVRYAQQSPLRGSAWSHDALELSLSPSIANA
jgi:hypothetical protein